MSLTNGMRLVTDLFIFDKITQLQKRDEVARETIISEEDLIFRMASNIQNTHIIRANDNLYNLSKKYYKDESKWIMIYEANKDKMSDPHSLQIGQELLIPDITVSI
jgi:nucleoid-associated protein YgaU